ncbi:MAG: hypothetical protein ACM3O7_02600 [Acidobacteriota bacterium]
MRNLRVAAVVAVAVAVAVCLCFPAWAQEKPGTVAMIYTVKAKGFDSEPLAQAIKKHYDWHRQHHDTTAWFVWQVVTGDNAGQFLGGSFGHHWKDFDARPDFDKADDADFFAHVLPLAERAVPAFYEFLPEMSSPTGAKEPSAMTQLTHYFIKPSGIAAFSDAIREITAALDKAGFPIHYEWYRLVSGGEGPHWVLAVARANWAAMEPPDKGLEDALAGVVGPRRSAELVAAVRDNTRSTYSEMLQYRPDLSYIPGK